MESAVGEFVVSLVRRGHVLDRETVRFEGDADTLLDVDGVSKLSLGG